MVKLANDGGRPSAELPSRQGDGPIRSAATGVLTHGLPLTEVLGASTLAGAKVLAGARGLGRVVQRLNVMEVPDILPWVKPHELLLTTGYPLRDTPEALAGLVAELDERGLAGLAIKLGRYIDALPPEMLAEADRREFPVVRIPDGVGFDDILNQVLTDVLNRQAAILARSEEVDRALVQIVLAGGGLQEVTDELVELLGGAVVATGVDGRVLAASGSAPDFAATRAASCFDQAGRFRVADEQAGIATHDGVPGQHLVVPVVAAGVDHGRLVAFSRHRRLTASDLHTLERAATVAALVVTRQLAVRAVDSKYQAAFLRDLLDGRAGPATDAVAHARGLGWDLDRPTVVVVARLDPAGNERPVAGEQRPVVARDADARARQDRFAAAWASALRGRDRSAAVVGFLKEVVAVLGAPAGHDAEQHVRQLVKQVAADSARVTAPFVTGISRVAPEASGIPAAYAQACRAMQVARQLRGAGAVASFDRLGVVRLLSLIPDPGELRAFVAETLGPLADPADAEAVDLRHTLQVLLDTNLNVAEAARALHFHYNTLRYRITKLERLLGPFTTDPRLRLDIAVALQAIQFRTS